MSKVEQYKKEMLEKKVWAVIGVTPDPDKFGYKIYKKLKAHGYTVYGINPKYDAVEGEMLYKSLKDLPEKPECIDIVVNPKLAKASLDEIESLGIDYVWFQPGTFDDEVISVAEGKDLKVVYNNCVLVALGGAH